jgi:S1-C subfamily serine protease
LAAILSVTAAAIAQPPTDFREALRTAEPALMTVTAAASRDPRRDGQAQPDRADVDAPNAPADPPGPRIELFELDDPGEVDRQRGRFEADQVASVSSAGFAIDEARLVAYLGRPAESLTVVDADGQTRDGRVVVMDHVTGLAVIEVEDAFFPQLLVSAAATEPGLPVVAAWLSEGHLQSDAGMVASHPLASQSGIGPTPRLDFGAGSLKIGAPVFSAEGIVVGVLVPSPSGRLVCARPVDLQRLIDAAQQDDPQDLKRGLVGIQFEGGGPLVLEVSPGSAAEGAGIEAGDLVQRVGETPIKTASDVVAAVSAARAGETLEITVQRGDQTLRLPVTLKEHPQQHLARFSGPSPQGGPGGLGLPQRFQWRDGQLAPMDDGPGGPGGPMPPAAGRIPLDDMRGLLRQFQVPFGQLDPFDRRPGGGGGPPGAQNPREVVPGEQSDVEETLRELRRQMEALNDRLERQPRREPEE